MYLCIIVLLYIRWILFQIIIFQFTRIQFSAATMFTLMLTLNFCSCSVVVLVAGIITLLQVIQIAATI